MMPSGKPENLSEVNMHTEQHITTSLMRHWCIKLLFTHNMEESCAGHGISRKKLWGGALSVGAGVFSPLVILRVTGYSGRYQGLTGNLKNYVLADYTGERGVRTLLTISSPWDARLT